MSINAKAHLKGIDTLYKKVRAFESRVKLEHTYSPVTDSRSYRDKDIDEVMAVFSESLNLDPGELSLVKNAMQAGELDLMSARFSETLSEEESTILYMVSRPFFKSMKRSADVDNIYWEEGRCPVCNAVPSLSVIEKESKRKYLCSFCGTAGYYTRIGCPKCLTDDPRNITVITLDGEEGMRADTCDTCMTYCKTFEGQMTADHSPDDLDILSLPLDIVVQEKGYKRVSPNPVGMMRMT